MATPGTGETISFVADAALGRLARYLRMMGYDVIYVRDQNGRAALREAVRRGRALLTRRRDLAGRADVLVFHVTADNVLAQVAAAARHFDLKLTPQAMTRCLECNAVLEPVTKNEVNDVLPPHVRRTQTTFTRCAACGRVYWPGTHYARSLARLLGALRASAAGTGT